jgi:hypothetical protein
MYGIVTLYDPAFQPSYPQCVAGNVPLDYNSDGEARQNDFQVELLPLHSQLLGESLLVSFPPLINMLKSSGSSYLISGPIDECNGGAGGMTSPPLALGTDRQVKALCRPCALKTALHYTTRTCLGALCSCANATTHHTRHVLTLLCWPPRRGHTRS